MKKIIAIVMALVMVFSLALVFTSCTKEPANEENTTDADNVVEAVEIVKLININLSDEEYAFGVDKAQPELLAQVNTFVEKILKDGTFDNICNNYFGDGKPVGVTSAELDETKDQLVVATNAEFAPFEYKEGELYYGIDMEVAALLAKELGKELVIDNMDFDSVCLAVGQHKCDIAMAGLTIDPAREESVTFSKAYYAASQQIIVKASDTRFDDCSDLAAVEAVLAALPAGTKIGAQTGTTGEAYIKGGSMGFDGLNAECVSYDSGALAVQDLINGGVDFVIIDAAPAAAIVSSVNG
ncbi:MAG: transporter substrate-binding domain-containing protein [Clostridia bacterium]|nr:transporter substrate-binding domain-containing protein [Clostridia bacterium]